MSEVLVIRGRRVVFDDHVAPAAIHIRDERIERVADFDSIPSDCELLETDDDSVIMPGLVDTHVHINSPGRTEWEGFETATRAAAAGGVTTLVDMPLNSDPPTTTVAALEAKRRAASGRSHVDIGFWGGAVPGNLAELAPLYAAGVYGFKCFLIDSGIPEFPRLDEAGLDSA